MSRVAYVNGRYVRHAQASVHIDDRGFQFADSVYEVCEVRDGRLIDETRHLARLERSLRALEMSAPVEMDALRVVLREVVRRNRVRYGIVYLQITRGTAARNHAFPEADLKGGLVVTARSADVGDFEAMARQGVAVITVADNRWERVDIKTIGLLPNVLAKQAAKAQGAFEAWFVKKDGTVTEGTSTNAWIVTNEGTLVTRPATTEILAGITRSRVVDLVGHLGAALEERPFSLEEAYSAREAFLTSSSNVAVPVISIDNRTIGDGRPGDLSREIRKIFHHHAEIGKQWASHRIELTPQNENNG